MSFDTARVHLNEGAKSYFRNLFHAYVLVPSWNQLYSSGGHHTYVFAVSPYGRPARLSICMSDAMQRLLEDDVVESMNTSEGGGNDKANVTTPATQGDSDNMTSDPMKWWEGWNWDNNDKDVAPVAASDWIIDATDSGSIVGSGFNRHFDRPIRRNVRPLMAEKLRRFRSLSSSTVVSYFRYCRVTHQYHAV